MTSKSADGEKIHQVTMEDIDQKKTTADKSENTIRRNSSKDIKERQETQIIQEHGQVKQTKQDLPNQRK